MNLTAQQIGRVVRRILRAAGANATESERVALRFAGANLVGHDSHGLIRVCQYAARLRDGTIRSGAKPELVARLGAVAIYDANLGFGQLAAEVTTEEGVGKAREFGVSAIGLRNVSHVGRLGDWAELAAEQGVISFHFVMGDRESRSHRAEAELACAQGVYATELCDRTCCRIALVSRACV